MAEKNPQEKIYEVAEAELKCNVCLNVPKFSPIFQCREGHIMCNDCNLKQIQCKICLNGNLGNIKILLAQKILGVPESTQNQCPCNKCERIRRIDMDDGTDEE